MHEEEVAREDLLREKHLLKKSLTESKEQAIQELRDTMKRETDKRDKIIVNERAEFARVKKELIENMEDMKKRYKRVLYIKLYIYIIIRIQYVYMLAIYYI